LFEKIFENLTRNGEGSLSTSCLSLYNQGIGAVLKNSWKECKVKSNVKGKKCKFQ